uniref:Uncharacterized protein n=1 Tax=Romanomermis culicivorax TaxID=13658 RepID=A0A915IUC6_ROMCU
MQKPVDEATDAAVVALAAAADNSDPDKMSVPNGVQNRLLQGEIQQETDTFFGLSNKNLSTHFLTEQKKKGMNEKIKLKNGSNV